LKPIGRAASPATSKAAARKPAKTPGKTKEAAVAVAGD